MTRKIGNSLVIQVESDDECELCGRMAELRPYGPNGERVCYDCGMKSVAAAKQKFAEFMDGKLQ